jgi:hypothetical protein
MYNTKEERNNVNPHWEEIAISSDQIFAPVSA